MTKSLELVGQRFWRFIVLERAENDRHGKTRWKCLCDCGTISIVHGSALKRGNTKSCGCLNDELRKTRFITHGHSSEGKTSPEYTAWYCMIQRCTNPKNKDYPNYGGRGITVCNRWVNSFESFLEDMGEKPSPNHSVERKNNNAGYSPENCTWADKVQQSRNQRTARNNRTGVRGVYWEKRHEKYYSKITVNKKEIYLGSFDTIEEAAETRIKAEQKYWHKSS
nr:AP2 domain-containing protein [Aneurinibacillus sp. XH2]